jgi:hypothetical protein
MAEDPAAEKASRDHEHDDLGSIFFYAERLEKACIQYVADAAADPRFGIRSPNTFTRLEDAIRGLVGPLPTEPPAAPDAPDPPLLLVQHRVNQRVQNIPPKNGGFS